jgi:parvulin-like peptidyl-prolyl isomerase
MLTRQLKSVGLTEDMLHEGLIQEATAREVLHSKVTITDEQARKYYEETPAAFDLPEMARISHILFLTTDPKTGTPITDDEKAAKKKRAEEALKRAKAGENFAALEKEYTEDTSRVDDKDGIKLYRGAKGIPAEFETAAFALQTNQISDIVASPLGFHIIKLAEKTPAGKEGFAEAEPNIKQFLQAQEIEKMLPKYTVELKKEENVEILDEKLKALDAIVTEATLKQLDGGATKTNVPVK